MTVEGQWLFFNQIAPTGLHQEVNFVRYFFMRAAEFDYKTDMQISSVCEKLGLVLSYKF